MESQVPTSPPAPEEGGEAAARLARSRAEQRSEELTRFRKRLAAGGSVTSADVDLSHERERDARDRAVRAHLRAEQAHERSAQMHRSAAELARANGDAEAAARHDDAAESDLRNAAVDRANAERDQAAATPDACGSV